MEMFKLEGAPGTLCSPAHTKGFITGGLHVGM